MKRRTLVSIFAALIPVAAVLRIVEMLKCIDPQNGFFYSASSGDSFLTLLLSKDSATGKEVWLSAGDVMYISMAFVAVAALLAFVFSFLAKDRKTLYLPPKNGLLLGIFSVLTGIGLFADIAIKIKSDVLDYITLYGKAENTTIIYLLALFGAAAAACFVIQGIGFVRGNGPSAAVYAFISVWSIFRLFVRYTLEFNGKALISENVLDIFALCSVMMTLLYLAHVYYRVGVKKSTGKLFAFGLCAAFFSVVSSVPRIFLGLTGRTELLSHSSSMGYCNLFFGIFVMVLLFAMSGKDSIGPDFDEEEADAEPEYVPMVSENRKILPAEETQIYGIPVKDVTSGKAFETQKSNPVSSETQVPAEPSKTAQKAPEQPQEEKAAEHDPFADFSVENIMAEIEKRGE